MYTYENERDDGSSPGKSRSKSFTSTGGGAGGTGTGGASRFGIRPPGTLTTLEDLKRQQSTGRYECVNEWNLQPAQCVTAFACVNSIRSPIAFCATSDK
jgi:hypothetical protein